MVSSIGGPVVGLIVSFPGTKAPSVQRWKVKCWGLWGPNAGLLMDEIRLSMVYEDERCIEPVQHSPPQYFG